MLNIEAAAQSAALIILDELLATRAAASVGGVAAEGGVLAHLHALVTGLKEREPFQTVAILVAVDTFEPKAPLTDTADTGHE